MITIEYCKNGDPISDFNYQDFIKKIKMNITRVNNRIEFPQTPYGLILFQVSTSLPILAIKLEIAKGTINWNQIQFKFKEQIFQANKYGAILDWPDGFCDIENKIAEETLRISLEKRKQEKENNY